MLDSLYNTDILTLSAGLSAGRLEGAHGTARKVSMLCGSSIEVDVIMAGDVVADMALRIEACALGQASAAIMQQAVVGTTVDELRSARDSLRAMLKKSAEPPAGRFAKLALLAGVRDYPARHNSTMLAFDAVVAAVEAALQNASL